MRVPTIVPLPRHRHRRGRGLWSRLLELVQPVASVPDSGKTTPVITLVPIAPRRGAERRRSGAGSEISSARRRAA